MRRREFITLIGGTAAAWPLRARAQTRRGIPRIGIIWAATEQDERYLSVLQEGLRSLGYIDGKTIKLENRYTEDYRQFGVIAAELVESQVDIIAASVTGVAVAAKQATKTIPIVFMNVSDPVRIQARGQPRASGRGCDRAIFNVD